MTKSTSDIPILDDDAVAEIEARANAATVGPWVYFGEPQDNVFWGEIRSAADEGGFAHITDTPELDERDNDMEFIAHAREDVPALCQTVRVLRAEMKTQKVELLQLSGRGELLAKVHVNFDDLDPLASVRNEFDRLRNIVIRDLQSQLEQVTKERDDARTENERLASQLKQWQEEQDTKAGYM